MIDIESKIFSPISIALKAEFDGIFVTSEPVAVSARFPAASIVMQDNYTSVNKMDNTLTEKFATLMFQVDVYSNKASGKKSECKKIMNFIDQMLYEQNFTRLSLTPIPMMDEGLYRYTARYRVETNGTNLYKV